MNRHRLQEGDVLNERSAEFLRLENTSYRTPDGRPLAAGISLNIKPAEITAVVGANGAGKSTFLRLLAGLHPPSEGAVRRFIKHDEIGFLPQLHNKEFHIPLTLADVLRLFQSPRPAAPDDASAWGLLHSRDLITPWNTASGGERQKTLLTGMLQSRARLLILDEPTNHLDLEGRERLAAALIRVAAAGSAVVITCHEKFLVLPGEAATAGKLPVHQLLPIGNRPMHVLEGKDGEGARRGDDA